MSFELAGTVLSSSEQVSTRGNKFLTFLLKTPAGMTFELSLFGTSMNAADKIHKGAEVVVKGELTSREYQDRNGKTRYGVQPQVQWIEAKGKAAPPLAADAPDIFDNIPF